MTKHLTFAFLLALGSTIALARPKGKKSPHWNGGESYKRRMCRVVIRTPRRGEVKYFQARYCQDARRQCQRSLRRSQRRGHYMRGRCVRASSWGQQHPQPQRKCVAVIRNRRARGIYSFSARNCRKARNKCLAKLDYLQSQGRRLWAYCEVRRQRPRRPR